MRRKLHAIVRRYILFVESVPDSNDKRTFVERYPQKAFGLHYFLFSEIFPFGLVSSFAKIGTRVDGVVDSFYLRETMNLLFTDALRREYLRKTLLRHMSHLSHVE